jgi:hypothetical protein
MTQDISISPLDLPEVESTVFTDLKRDVTLTHVGGYM